MTPPPEVVAVTDPPQDGNEMRPKENMDKGRQDQMRKKGHERGWHSLLEVLTDSTINHEEELPDSTSSLNRQSLRQVKYSCLPMRDLMSLYNVQNKDLES
ncbi:hypothetical protein YC2023_094488 [Brassica napus]